MTELSSVDGHCLRCLQLSSRVRDENDWPEVSMILVPDALSSRATRLSESSWAWLSPISEEAGVRAQYHEFQYHPVAGENSIWQSLNDGGDVLLGLLLQLESQVKALTRISERYFDPAIRRLADKLTQIILIGCPHPTIDDKSKWPLLDRVLKHDRKLNSRELKAMAEEAGIVANLCSKFQEAGVRCSLITTYESQPTTIRHWATILKPEKYTLVGREFAKTCVRNEELVALNLENRDVGSLKKNHAANNDFRQRVKSALAESNARIPQGERHPQLFRGNPFASTASEVTHSIAPPPPPQQNQHPKLVLSNPVLATAGTSTDRSTSVGSSTREVAFEYRRVARLPCHVFGRHPRNMNFFNRPALLKEIDSYMIPSSPDQRSNGTETLRSFALYGMGGIGKTQLALEYAYTRKSEFDAIFWITADSKANIAECFSNIALSLGIATESEVSDLTVSFSILLRWLSNPTKVMTTPGGGEKVTDASWLIIFDNADDISLMSEFWPSTGVGSVLITTRDPAGKDFCLARGIAVEPLSNDDALKFFQTQLDLDTRASQQVDAEFVARFGGLPLAIMQVTSLIRRRQLTISEFSHTYDISIQQSGLADFQVSQHDGSYRQSIFTVWAFESLDKTTQALLNVMSLLDPFHIQEFILTQEIPNLFTSLYPNKKADYVESRSDLLKASLITRSLPTEHVEVHPLVQEVLQALMGEKQLSESFSIAVSLIHKSWSSETVKWGHETSHREQSALLLPHVLRLLVVFEKSLSDMSRYLYERGEHQSALPILTTCLDIARKRSHERPDLLADVLMSLAALGLHTSSPDEVLQNSKEHLDLRQQVYKSHTGSGKIPLQTQYDYAMGVATMAMAHNYAGEFDKAIPYATKSLELYNSFPMYRNWQTVPYFAVAHAGWALWSLGRYEEAEEVFLKAVNADRERGTPGCYGHAGLLLPLGNVQMNLGKHKEAAAAHEEALLMYYAANGNNYKTAQARLKHAEHLARSGDHEEACVQYQLAVEAFSRNVYYKPEQSRALIKAAQHMLSIGEVAKAGDLFQQAQNVLGESGIRKDVKELDDETMDNMVRMWSR
ncbi:hypothetical protein O1611_g1537 [Lasiodiplodia mahajangana]|uniref:Uncharacterized protein n=1 Tax=Lasiodiplodia mahajangana TaxID=1108764 RepID=A0ACC2JXD5_9PEZI|nr:hypothetical protein O1611_g1537 [Lasiodiplodia mahajangana]